MTRQEKKTLTAKLCVFIDDQEEADNPGIIKSLNGQTVDVKFGNLKFSGIVQKQIVVMGDGEQSVGLLFKEDIDLEITNDDSKFVLEVAKKCKEMKASTQFESILTFCINSKNTIEIKTVNEFAIYKTGPNIKILRIKNIKTLEEVWKILRSREFSDFVLRSPGLFALDIGIDCIINELKVAEELENILNSEKSWIIQVKCNKTFNEIFYKEAKTNIKAVGQLDVFDFDKISYLEFLKDKCNFESLMQGFIFSLLGTFDGNILNAKLFKNFNRADLLAATEKNGLCLRYLLEFYDSSNGDKNEKSFRSLLNAIEVNNFKLVKDLLESGMTGNRAYCDIAWELKHFEGLEELLKADSPFPKNFNPTIYDFSHLVNAVNSFHEDIKSGVIEKVEKFVAESPRIKFAYDLTNKTAISVALKAKQLKTYAYLRSRGFSHGVDETFFVNLENLTYEEKKNIQEENSKYFKSSDNSHLFYILSKTKIAFNSGSLEKEFEIVRKMLEDLNEIEEIRPILKAVEHVDLKIVFDFDKKAVNDMIPTKPETELGTCFFNTGQIFVGAKDHEERYNEVIGTLIHEISHYVMNLIYRNGAKPFLPADSDKEKRHKKIIRSLQAYYLENQQTVNPILRSIFRCYHKEKWQYELIVCVPEILATYRNDREKVEEILDYAGDLFHFFYESTLEDIKNISFLIQPKQAIRELNDLLGTLHEVYNSKISFKENDFDISSDSNSRLIASNATTLSMVMILEAFYELHREACDCHIIFAKIGALNKVLLDKIKKAMNSSVKPHFVVNVTDGREKELEMLSTFLTLQKLGERIILVSTIDESEKLQEIFAEPEFYCHGWKDVDNETQKLLLSRNINFQGYDVNLYKIVARTSDSLEKIQLKDLVEENLLKIGESLVNLNNGFAIPRKFQCWQFTKVKRMEPSVRGSYGNLLEEGKKKKKMLISDMAGTGKTVMLKEIAVKLKKENPNRWVTLIDLIDFIDFFKKLLLERHNFEKSSNLQGFMLEIFYRHLENFDKAIFEELYETGRITLLLDSFDEISPYYKEIVIKFIKSFEIKDGNQLWVATRLHLEEELMVAMEATLVKLENLTKEEQIDFLIQSWSKENYEMKDFEEKKSLAENLITQLEVLTSSNSGFVGIPILIGMVAKIYKDRKFNKNEKLSFFKIYHNFVEKLFSVWRERGKVSKMEQSLLDSKTGVLNVMEAHQKLAIDHIFKGEFADVDQQFVSTWTNEMISRVGIITKDEKTCKFLHETFAEYLVARHLSEIIEGTGRKQQKLNLFMKILAEEDFQVIRSFLNESFEKINSTDVFQKKLTETIDTKIKTGECQILLANIIKEGHKNILGILNFQLLEKSVLKKILNERCSGRNLLFHAAMSSIPMVVQLFDFIKTATNENEARNITLEMFKEKSFLGDNAILDYLQFGNSENVFDDLCSVLKQVANQMEIKKLFLERNLESRNILGCLAMNLKTKLKLMKLWSFLKTLLEPFELFKILIAMDNENQRDAILDALFCGHGSFAEDYFEILKEFPATQQKLSLELKDKNGYNILHALPFCKNFPTLFDCLRIYLSNAEINVMLHEKLKNNRNILSAIAESSVPDGFSKLVNCVEKIADKNESRKTILRMFREKDDFGCNMFFKFFRLGKSQEVFDDLRSVLEKVASREERKELFLRKNRKSKNVLRYLAGYSEIDLQKIWSFLKSFLSSSEFFELLIEKNSEDGRNALHLAVFEGNGKFIIDISEIIEELSINVRKFLLKSEDKFDWNILHLACSSKNFTLAFDCLKKNLSDSDIEILFKKKTNDESNIFSIASKSSVSNIFTQLFNCMENINENMFLEIFKEKNSLGDNAILDFLKFAKSEKVFEDLCSVLKQIANQIEIKKLLLEKNKKLRGILGCLSINFETQIKLTKLWSFLKTYFDLSELFKLLVEKQNEYGENVLNFALSNGNKEFTNHVLEIMKEFPTSQQKLLLCFEDEHGYNILHSACFCKNFSTIFDSLRNYLSNDEIKTMLLKEVKDGSNIFFMASGSPVSNIFSQIFYYIKSLTNEKEAERKVLEMFKTKNMYGNTVINVYFIFRKSEKVFNDFCTILKKVANQEEIKSLFLEKNLNDRNVLGCLSENLRIEFNLPKLWSFLKTFLGSFEVFKLLVQKDKDHECNALHLALSAGNEDFVKDLFIIMKEFSFEQRKLLFESLDKFDNNILHSACLSERRILATIVGCLEYFSSLEDIIKMFWETNESGFIPIHELARVNNAHLLEEMYEVVTRISSRNEFEKMMFTETPNQQNILHIAIEENENLNFVEKFFNLSDSFFRDSRSKLNEMINKLDLEGKTPLMLAQDQGKEEFYSFLLEASKL